ncbi:teichuronic acid biosynthesis glycosyltransferase TuaG [Acetitomaculum ruminis DSM 5522]|uniref:Teichuronic acid biosynthesis glycosyltransferase TuaG n=1 Tax=Acetitomaculum ruminis DSM 5522 TaxID=1120918 RepID=A0A1I0VP85_9FIRM|nr:glycosyltransferase family 2 protein [Acetitomaculum ruminis]SFA77446.1 teichuronic acid biosynthesis glycosyltransferase TuaG [Acetitomaculum ruminis DSM 5522]
MSRFLVSVIMPNYNGEKYIKMAIDSVLDQTLKGDIQLIVIDDCSIDKSVDVIMQLMDARDANRKEFFIKNDTVDEYYKYSCFEIFNGDYVRNIIVLESRKNFGVARSRNLGFEIAFGSFIALLDSDDYWDLNKLEIQLKAFEDKECVICGSSRELINEDGSRTGKIISMPPKVTRKMLLYTNSIPCSSVVLRSSVTKEYKMTNDNLHEDYIMWLNILEDYPYAIGIDKPLLKSRLSIGGKSRNKFRSAKMQYGAYRHIGLNSLTSLYYLFFYIINGIFKYRR